MVMANVTSGIVRLGVVAFAPYLFEALWLTGAILILTMMTEAPIVRLLLEQMHIQPPRLLRGVFLVNALSLVLTWALFPPR